MKILIIGDIHGREFWEDAVKKYGNECDKIIMLGDIVDPYPDEGYTRKQAIKTLENVIEFKRNNREKTVLLIGNHDAHYFIKNFTRSSRYDSSNAYKLREIYSKSKGLFKLAHEEAINGKRYLFTHAGLMNSWVKRNEKVIGEPTPESLNRLIDIPRGVAALAEMSVYRTWIGEKTGSILWSDVREKIDDNSEIDNIVPDDDSIVEMYDYQIFGHTQLIDKPIITDKWACIDCRKAFILDEDGTLTSVTEEKENKED